MAHIFVIDDEQEVCDLLQTFLTSEGHSVEYATSSEGVVEKAQQFSPDLILLDIVMPERNGLALLPYLKTAMPTSYIVVITGIDDYRIADIFYESGISGFLTKPIRLDNLLLTVNRLLDPAAPSL